MSMFFFSGVIVMSKLVSFIFTLHNGFYLSKQTHGVSILIINIFKIHLINLLGHSSFIRSLVYLLNYWIIGQTI